jgi:phosphate starvation-inducible PhoH-like protein
MFLTRMGKSSKFIINGDITQIDLPYKQPSGLIQAIDILQDVKGIGFVFLDEKDVVRHKLVTRIIKAYAQTEKQSEMRITSPLPIPSEPSSETT